MSRLKKTPKDDISTMVSLCGANKVWLLFFSQFDSYSSDCLVSADSAMLDGMNPTLAVLREKFLGMVFADSSFARWVAATMWYLEAVAHPLVYWQLILGR